ncbi:hypothetical protein, partial [Rhizobium ruizarguesonis]|uniref:hypothetical protein n=1 Tax=Rhizobium ruizarguesonis TaxID=2081791 RepID=UPI001952EF9E
MSALMLVLMPEHRPICPISKIRSPDAHLEVWDWDQRKLLGRCDAFIPMNIDLEATKRTYDAIVSNYEDL